MLKKWWKLKARVTTRVKVKLTMKVNLNLNRVKVTETANRHDRTTNKRKKVGVLAKNTPKVPIFCFSGF